MSEERDKAEGVANATQMPAPPDLSPLFQKVFVIAAAAKSPELALASIPPVLALANAAFAEVPLADQKSQTALQAAFAPFTE